RTRRWCSSSTILRTRTCTTSPLIWRRCSRGNDSMRRIPFLALLCAAPVFGQGGPLDPADLLKPLSNNWTSYSGDYSGKRFSSLKQVNVNTVKNLSLRWVNTNVRSGCGPNGTGPNGPSNPLIVSGFGDGSSNSCTTARIQGGVIVVN